MHTDSEWAPFGITAERAAVLEAWISDTAPNLVRKPSLCPELVDDVRQQMWYALVVPPEGGVALLPRHANKPDSYLFKAMRNAAKKWLNRKAFDGPLVKFGKDMVVDTDRVLPLLHDIEK